MEARKCQQTSVIRELDREASNFTRCALFVGFEKGSTTFIWADDPDRGRALEKAVKYGGKPMGLIGGRISGNMGPRSKARTGLNQWRLAIAVRPFKEYANEDWLAEYLEKLAGNFRLRAILLKDRQIAWQETG